MNLTGTTSKIHEKVQNLFYLLKTSLLVSLKSLYAGGNTISNPIAISYIFNNYFSSIAKKTNLTIRLLHKDLSDFLQNRSNIFFFVSNPNKTEIGDVLSSLDYNNLVGIISIPIKILKYLKVTFPLPEIFNMSFSSGVFPLTLKTAKVTLCVRRIPSLIHQIVALSYFYLVLKNF